MEAELLVKSYVSDPCGRRLAELRTVRDDATTWRTVVILTEDCPDGPDVVTLIQHSASAARTIHLGTARAIAGRDGKIATELPGLMKEAV